LSATAAERPSPSVTALMGNCSSRSVSQLACRVWHSRGHGVRPAFLEWAVSVPGVRLTGKYKGKPLEGSEVDVEVYAGHLTDRKTGGGGSGTLKEMVAAVERHVNRHIVLGKVENLPGRVNWHFNVRSPMIRDPAKGIDTYREDTNPAAVLHNMAEQTGLTVTTEKRKVRILVVEHVEVKK
jgi:hypothetical protein